MKNRNSFVVFRRVGDVVTAYPARLVARRWINGKPEGQEVKIVGPAIPWAELYKGHCAWIGEQIAKTREAIKRERTRRAAKKAQGPLASASV